MDEEDPGKQCIIMKKNRNDSGQENGKRPMRGWLPASGTFCDARAHQCFRFSSLIQKCHLGALGIGSCLISARMTRRWEKQQHTRSSIMIHAIADIFLFSFLMFFSSVAEAFLPVPASHAGHSRRCDHPAGYRLSARPGKAGSAVHREGMYS